MKKYLKYILIILIICSACQDIFHDEDNSYIVLDTEQEKIDVLNGVYSLINHVHNHSYFNTCSRADDINMYVNYSFPQGCSASGGTTMSQEIIDNVYKKLYTAIVTSNSLIEQTSASENPAILGEAYFLRAYCYLKLARFFGRPPLVKDTDISFTLTKPTFKEVYEFIESDMQLAIDLLPESIEKARIPYETVTKNAAKALLAEVYLSMAGYPVNDTEKYAQAAKLSGEVIESGEYQLLEDLNDLWSEKNRHHRENIFGLFYNQETSDSWTNPDYNSINQTSFSYDSYNGYGYISYTSSFSPEFMYYLNFPDNYRKYSFFNTGSYNYETLLNVDGSKIKVLYFNEADPFENPCSYVKTVASLKHFDMATLNLLANSSIYRNYSKVNLYLLRYAHTLLTFAESKARIGEIDAAAFDAINQIRRRANKTSLNEQSKFDLRSNITQNQFIDSVVWERAWELCYEPDGRWFDIIRLDLKDKLEEYRSDLDKVTTFNNIYLSDEWYFFNIPQHDIDINPNLE